MKTGQLAKILGVDSQTVIQWAGRVEKYLSPSAVGKGGTQRDFNDNDVMVLNTVRDLRSKGTAFPDIEEAVGRGQFSSKLPDTAATTTGITPVQVYAQNLAVVQQLEEKQRRVDELEKQLETERSDHQAEKEKLLREMAELSNQLGKAQGRAELLKELLDEERGRD